MKVNSYVCRHCRGKTGREVLFDPPPSWIGWTARQKTNLRNVSENNMWTKIKFSKTQISKTIQSILIGLELNMFIKRLKRLLEIKTFKQI